MLFQLLSATIPLKSYFQLIGKVKGKDGAVVPTADNKIFFTVEGGQFLGTGNPESHRIGV